MSTKYKIINGTSYHKETSDKMIKILENIRQNQTRVRFHWGNVVTGKDWGDCFDVKGRIGRSTGKFKIPILIYNSRSFGGSAILDNCIVKITTTKGNIVLYKHDKYNK